MARGQKLDTNQDRNAASDKQKIPDIYRVKAICAVIGLNSYTTQWDSNCD